MFWPNLLLDVSVLGDAVRPDYDNLTPTKFVAGYSALMLVYLPEELRGSVVENMLGHFNHLMFASVTDWSNILGFNQQFVKSCEHHQMLFANWTIMHHWHEHHFGTLRLLNASRPWRNEKSKEDKHDPKSVPDNFVRSQQLCFKFQKGQCVEKDSHQLGKNALVHACAFCMYKKNAEPSRTTGPTTAQSIRNPQRKRVFEVGEVPSSPSTSPPSFRVPPPPVS
jgi:hypothetical protein